MQVTPTLITGVVGFYVLSKVVQINSRRLLFWFVEGGHTIGFAEHEPVIIWIGNKFANFFFIFIYVSHPK